LSLARPFHARAIQPSLLNAPNRFFCSAKAAVHAEEEVEATPKNLVA